MFEDLAVAGFVHGDDVVGAVFAASVGPGAASHFAGAARGGEDGESEIGGGIDVTGRNEEAILAMGDDLGKSADIGGDDGNFASHGFESGEAEGFQLAGKKEEIGGGELLLDGILLAEEEDAGGEIEFADEPFGGAAVRAIADHDEACGELAADASEDLDDV